MSRVRYFDQKWIEATLVGHWLKVKKMVEEALANYSMPSEGPPGVGVPTGGTTGQILAKRSSANHDTHWINPPSGEDGHCEGGHGDVVGARRMLQPGVDFECFTEEEEVDSEDETQILELSVEFSQPIGLFDDLVLSGEIILYEDGEREVALPGEIAFSKHRTTARLYTTTTMAPLSYNIANLEASLAMLSLATAGVHFPVWWEGNTLRARLEAKPLAMENGQINFGETINTFLAFILFAANPISVLKTSFGGEV
jgi:hypothetical protein